MASSLLVLGLFADVGLSWRSSRHVLTVVQQPLGSAEFGSNVLSRLPLSPALIVQLECFDADNNSVDMWVLFFVYDFLTSFR